MRKFLALLLFTILLLSITTVGLSSMAEDVNYFHTSDSSVFSEEDSFNNLNYGLYWVKKGNIYEKADSDTEIYDSSKPTMIFIHGFQSNSGYFKRETLAVGDNAWVDENDSIFLADYWIEAGYNVGMYQWNQLCDESSQIAAEAKIWSVNGSRGMRYRKSNGSYTNESYEGNPAKPMAYLFVEEYLNVMANHQGGEIRLVGHSMGGMFSIAVMGLMYEKIQKGEMDERLLPSRLSLLDPYLGTSISLKGSFDIYWKDSSDKFTNANVKLVCKDYIKKLHHYGVAVDYYRTTMVGDLGLMNNVIGEDDFDLVPYMTLIRYNASAMTEHTFITDSQGPMHIAARDFYLYSFAFDTIADQSNLSSGNLAITASTPNHIVYANHGRVFRSFSANNTLSPMDDEFGLVGEDNSSLIITGKISGFVFNDSNKNLLRDDGPSNGFNDVQVKLYNSNGEMLETTTTNNIGFYSLSSPGAGEYYIEFGKVKQAGIVAPNDINNSDITLNINKDGRTDNFTLASSSSDKVINCAMASSDFLSKPYIITYFVSGLILLSILILFIYIYSLRKSKAVEDII